jgi:hypothetical protein
MSEKRVTLLPVDQVFARERKGIKRDTKGRLHWDNYNYKEATMPPTDNIPKQSPAGDALETKLVYQENAVVVTIFKSTTAADVVSLARIQFAQLANVADADLIVYVVRSKQHDVCLSFFFANQYSSRLEKVWHVYIKSTRSDDLDATQLHPSRTSPN